MATLVLKLVDEDVKRGYEGLKLLVMMYRETLKASLGSLGAQDERTAEMFASLINRCTKAIETIEKRMKEERGIVDVKEEIFSLVEDTDRLLGLFEEEEGIERSVERAEN